MIKVVIKRTKLHKRFLKREIGNCSNAYISYSNYSVNLLRKTKRVHFAIVNTNENVNNRIFFKLV